MQKSLGSFACVSTGGRGKFRHTRSHMRTRAPKKRSSEDEGKTVFPFTGYKEKGKKGRRVRSNVHRLGRRFLSLCFLPLPLLRLLRLRGAKERDPPLVVPRSEGACDNPKVLPLTVRQAQMRQDVRHADDGGGRDLVGRPGGHPLPVFRHSHAARRWVCRPRSLSRKSLPTDFFRMRTRCVL